jgi:hypothetical protein
LTQKKENMNRLLAPAALLMQRLPLLPKFAVVAFLFLAPLLLVSLLLFGELARAIDSAEQERAGLRQLMSLEETTHLLLTHRGLRHLAGAGNSIAEKRAAITQAALERRFNELPDTRSPGASGLAEIRRTWQALASTDTAVGRYDEHTHLVRTLTQRAAAIADESGVSMDPAPDAHHLAIAAVETLPAIAANLAHIAARGAAYIDTGLMEPNEDVVLQSAVQVARRDLQRAPEQFEAAFAQNPALRSTLAPQLAALDTALAFLDRAENELLKAVDQTSGMAFCEAGESA